MRFGSNGYRTALCRFLAEEERAVLLSRRIRDQISSLWQCFSGAGVPEHQVVEQITYLLVIRQIEERELASLRCFPEPVRWSILKGLPDDECLEYMAHSAFPWLANLELDGQPHLSSAWCALSKGRTLRRVMDLIDELFPSPHGLTAHAIVYDALLTLAEEATATWSRRRGAYFTPHHISDVLVDLLQPQPGESICDLSCGNGRLLASAHRAVLQALSDSVSIGYSADGCHLMLGEPQLGVLGMECLRRTRYTGFDIDHSSAMQAWALMRCFDVDASSIGLADTLGETFNRKLSVNGGSVGGFDVIVGNPPYSSCVDKGNLGESLRWLGTDKAEALFVELVMQALRSGGRAALIVPDGLLFNRDKAHRTLRRKLLQHDVLAIISLPAGVFLPFTNVKTSILVFASGRETDHPLWFYAVGADGRSLDRKRRMVPELNDLPDLAIKYRIRQLQQPGEWLRETQALATCCHAAFIDGDVQLQWENIPPELYSYYYAHPHCEYETRCDSAGETQQVLLFKKTLARPADEPKDWMVHLADLDRDCTLVPSRYKPTPLPGGGYSVYARQIQRDADQRFRMCA